MPSKKVKTKKKNILRKPARVRKAPVKKKSTRKTVIKLEAPVFSASPVSITPVIQSPVKQTPAPAAPRQDFLAPKSPHVLNLKKIAFENHVHETRREQKSKELQRQISQQLAQSAEKAQAQSKKSNSFFLLKKNPVEKSAPEEKVYSLPKHTVVSEVILDEEPSAPKKAAALKSIKIPRVGLKGKAISRLIPRIEGPLFSSSYTRRSVVSFVLASLLLVSPLWAFDTYQKLSETKGKVIDIAGSALENLKNSDGGSNTDELAQASAKLKQAEDELSNVPDLVNAILAAAPDGTKLSAGKNLLHIAQESSALAQAFVSLLSSNPDSHTLYERLNLLLPTLTSQQASLSSISKDIESINPDDIPAQYREQFKGVSEIVAAIAPHIQALLEQANLLTAMMGSESAQRYLIVFQNTDELRPAGGFMGSFATLTMDKGAIKDFSIPPGGSYDLRAGLRANIEPPHPLTAVTPRWEFQDANYFADFPTSAHKIMSFYEKSGGTTVNGVIAINSSLLPKLLGLTGPIHLPTSGLDITADNVVEVLETEIETGPNKEINQPKKVLRELSDALIANLSSQASSAFPKLAEILLNALTSRDIQINLTDPDLQSIIAKRNWDGSLIKTDGDYLNIVSTNVAGGKSNGVLHDSVSVTADIQDDGSVIDTVRLTRRHAGTPDHPLSDIKNNDYLRFFVPLNATLISARGFEPLPEDAFRPADFPEVKDRDLSISQSTAKVDLESKTEIYMESGKTVFGNWMQVSPGETKTVTISYRLPFTVSAGKAEAPNSWLGIITNEFSAPSDSIPYSLILQKQAGKTNQTYHVEIHAPDALSYLWSYPSNINANGNVFTLDQILDRDAIIGIIFKNK